MLSIDKKVSYIIERFDKFDDRCVDDVALALSTYVFNKTYEVLSQNHDITFEEFKRMMDMNYIQFVHDFFIEKDAILVRLYDYNNQYDNNEIYQWLNENGFVQKEEFNNCSWVYVDLINKTYYPGKAGVEYFTPAYNHSINDNEFLTIMNIINHYETITDLEYRLINYIFDRKYISVFVPAKLTNYEMEQIVIAKLEDMNAGSVVINWSCDERKIKKCYNLILDNPNISLHDYFELSGWNRSKW